MAAFNAPARDEIHLFSEKLIDQHPALALDVLALSHKFALRFGWHYLLDFIWVLDKLKLPGPARVLDAGGGSGLMPFMLATAGHQVLSADALVISLPEAVKKIIDYKKSGSQTALQTAYAKHLGREKQKEPEPLPVRAPVSFGEIEYHCCNLENLEHIHDNEFEAIVSISALEHNPPEQIPVIMKELRRVARPGAPLLITISTDRVSGFNEPSLSWLLDEGQLVRYYGLAEGYISNFNQLDEIYQSLKQSPRLSRWLPSFYYASGQKGMPWGLWNPAYLPAGLLIWNRK